MEQDRDGNIWVSHAYKGLFKIDLSQDLKAINSIAFYDAAKGLASNLFVNIVKIGEELIITSPKGVFKYDYQDDKFYPHLEFNEVFKEHQVIHRIIEDQLGNIWFSADSDFGVIKKRGNGVFQKLEIQYFNQIRDDLVDGFEHIFAYDNQNIIIGCESGFIHFNPSGEQIANLPFRTLIRKVVLTTLGDSTLIWGNPGMKYDKPFHHKLNDFRFSYSTPYYDKIEHIQFRYKLEGFDEVWAPWTTKSEKGIY